MRRLLAGLIALAAFALPAYGQGIGGGVYSDPVTLASLGGVPTSRTITAGTGLTGGGDLSANRTLTVINPSPSTSVAGDIVTFSNATGALQDSGTLLSSLLTSSNAASTYAPLATPAFTSSIGVGSSGQIVVGDAANSISLRNGTNPQTFYVYGTYTNASNYERFSIAETAGVWTLSNVGAGSGSNRINRIVTAGVVYDFTSTGFNSGGSIAATTSASAVAYIGTGSAPTASGSCSVNTQTGGNTAGTFKANGACVAGTVILTFATTAPAGWTCDAHDMTTPTSLMNQTGSSQTTATFTGSMTSLDVVNYKCTAY